MKKTPLFLGLLAAALPLTAFAQPPKLEVQEVADTGSMPKGASLSPDGKHYYVTNFGQLDKRNITIYDAETLKLESEIDVPGVVVESALSPDGKTLYVSNFRRSSVMFIDVATKAVTHELKTGTHPKVLVVSPDGKSLFAANWATNDVTQIDTAKAEIVRTLKVGRQPRGMAVSKKGTLYVANFFGDSIDVFTGADYSEKKRIPVCKVPRHLALSPDEKTLYISCLNVSQLHAMDTTSFEIAHRVPIGNAPKSIDVSKDGRYVYSADFGHTHSVTVVDTHEWASRVFTVPGMDRGSGVVVAKDGKHALVTGWFDNHIYLVGFEGSGGHPEEAKKRIHRWQYRPKHEGSEGTGG